MNSTYCTCTQCSSAESSTTSVVYNSNTGLSPQVSLFLCCNSWDSSPFLKNACDVSESFTSLRRASVGQDGLRVISNDAFVDNKEEDEYYFAYGDVSQIWKRQIKPTGRMVCSSRCLHLVLNFDRFLDIGRNQGIQDDGTCWPR